MEHKPRVIKFASVAPWAIIVGLLLLGVGGIDESLMFALLLLGVMLLAWYLYARSKRSSRGGRPGR